MLFVNYVTSYVLRNFFLLKFISKTHLYGPTNKKIIWDHKLQCKSGEVEVIHGIEMDSWSYFQALRMKDDFGYKGKLKLWWKNQSCIFENGLRKIVLDTHATEMGSYE